MGTNWNLWPQSEISHHIYVFVGTVLNPFPHVAICSNKFISTDSDFCYHIFQYIATDSYTCKHIGICGNK